MSDEGFEPLLQEMQSIKKLLLLQLLAFGYKQKHLAAALEVSEATLSRTLPKGLPKNLLGKINGFVGEIHDE